MNTTRIAASFLLIATLVATPMAYGGGTFQKNGFTISLPDGWVEIPRDVLDSYEKALGALAPGAPVQRYDCGFQLDGAKDWFAYPYVVIQVKNAGRIPENKLEELEGFSAQETLEDQKAKLSAVMSDIQVGKMIYDSRNKMIWMRIELNVRDVGPVSGLTGMVLTEKGFIQANAYSAKDDYPSYEPVFRSILTSVAPDPGLVYKQRWSDRLPAALTGIDWGKAAGKALAGAIVGALLALIIRLRRKKDRS